MSILDIFNNPTSANNKAATKSDRLIRFPQGKKPSVGNSYQPYEVNDQTSLANSKLHTGFSTEGAPKVNTANANYSAGQKIPTRILDIEKSTNNDGNSGFSQEFTPNNQYRDKFTSSPQ